MKDQRLINQRERLLDMLADLDPTTDRYAEVLKNIEHLGWMINDGDRDIMPAIPMSESKDEDEVVAKPIEEEPASTKPEPVAEPVQQTVVEETPVEQTNSTYSKEAVRDLLSDAARKGIQIQPIIAQFVPEGKPMKLSEVKAKDYPALVEAVQNAQ